MQKQKYFHPDLVPWKRNVLFQDKAFLPGKAVFQSKCLISGALRCHWASARKEMREPEIPWQKTVAGARVYVSLFILQQTAAGAAAHNPFPDCLV